MLEDQQSVGPEQVAMQHLVDDPFAALQVVRSIGEYQVEFLGARLQVEKDIRLHRVEIRDAQLRRR